MSDNVLRINEMYYQLGVIQEFKDGRRFTETDKKDGGWPDDLNEYGCRVASSNHILTPGDIEIPPIDHDENEINMEEEAQYLEKLDEELKNNKTTDDETKERYERILYSRRCQLNGEVPPCEMYILLTIHLPDDSKKFEAVKYDKQLYQAMKYLTTQIFGERDCVVIVKNFDIFFPTTHFGFIRIHINDVKDLCIKFEPIPGAVASFYADYPRWLLEIYTGERKDAGFFKSTLENLYDEIETSFSKP
ncbi:hypothetical protein CAEBREN_06371 [Caenorhabditis brenneri]|uniref:Uncharacterized protein n=1 Tax=Caenorhabditis brenneri TaxID=135651 RepID=G0MDT5_CAEBE|nr:hypothetical protein CAEBREN_06371 [Caenorhabditis brenneri]